MTESLLINTDILIDCLRGRAEALFFIEQLSAPQYISAVSVAELYAGVREAERVDLDAFLAAFRVVAVSEDIARAGGLHRRDAGGIHGTGLVDGIIAATSASLGTRLATLNARHFPMLRDVLVPY